MHVQVTGYGPSTKVGGWDKFSDPGTDMGYGAFGNKLNASSCALTHPVVDGLSLKQGDWVNIDFGTWIMKRRYDDRAMWSNPNANARVDLYMYVGFDKTIPDYAEVTKA